MTPVVLDSSAGFAYVPAVPRNFDVIVLGLGAMGSATAWQLARRGVRVLGIDQFTPPHDRGSSHGLTRIIREAYFEHPCYVPLVQRAYELWEEASRESGEALFRQTGGLMIGPPEGAVVGGARRSAELHRLPHEVLTAAEVRRRFPALNPDDDFSAVLEPRAGVLFPERCIAAHLALARRAGAGLLFDTPVLRWEPAGEGVRITTASGEYLAGQLVLTAGSWIQSLLRGVALPFAVERQVQFWFEPARSPELFGPDRCPIYLWQFDGEHYFYGFPNLGDGVKVAGHHAGEIATAETIRRDIAPAEVEAMRAVVRRFLPAADGPLRAAVVCQYTNTPDQHFWIDRHPEHSQVLIASPCSGHGFKFSSAIGDVLADLVTTGSTRFDLELFRQRG